MPDSAAQPKDKAPETDLFQGIVDKLGAYYREIAAFVLLIVGAGVIYAIAQNVQQQADQKAWTELYKAQFDARSTTGRVEAATYGELFNKHIDTHAAPYIGLRYIQSLASDDTPDEALKQTRLWLEKFPDHSLAPATQLTLAQLLMRGDKWGEAKQVLLKVEVLAQRPENRHLEPEVRLNYAQCLAREASDARGSSEYIAYLDAARDAYNRVLSRTGWASPLRAEAELAASVLEERARQARAGETIAPATPMQDVPVPDKPDADTPTTEGGETPDADADAGADEDSETEPAADSDPATEGN